MPLQQQYRCIRFIFGDQLNASHTWLSHIDPSILYVMAELPSELSYVKHHIQKITAFLAAMFQFSKELEAAGHDVLHLTLEQTYEYQSLQALLLNLIQDFQVECFEYQQPDEYRLCQKMQSLQLGVETQVYDTEHFLLPHEEIPRYFSAEKPVIMESFYRQMRQQTGYLMASGKPLGGKWNYDVNNRKKLKQSDLHNIPDPLCFENDVSEIVKRLDHYQVVYFGKVEIDLLWPVTRAQSLQLLQHFCDQCLLYFGQFQDAMTNQIDASWSLYHSRLSFALNSKMISPKEVIEQSIASFEASEGMIDIAQVEGFTRQILGWREYIRGMYWIHMPTYQQLNFFNATRTLPTYFWNAKTDMACMKACLEQSLTTSYAHHIQRLMVIGNFCLLAGIDPDQVDQWYLGVYVDAIEWVEMPNTRGMSQYADGGLIATKPYCASGSYINKMSDYCKSCRYQVKEKVTEDACPFNALYWHFMHRHQHLLEKNPRIGMAYRTWQQRFSESQRQQILATAERTLIRLEQL